MRHLRTALVLAAAAFTLGMSLASSPAQAEDCKPPCWKDPYTGQIICGTPCP